MLFAALTALTAFFAVLYLAFPFITPLYGWEILVGVMIEVVGLAAVWRLVLLRRTLSERSLYRIDFAIAVMLGIAFACAAFFAPERKAAATPTDGNNGAQFSLGIDMDATRFYFADAAAQQVMSTLLLKNQATIEDVFAFALKVNIALASLIGAFIRSRNPA